ncbi:MAG TPA: hypothetical protein VGQ76_05425 [Thermoanaerobaculia bacterium]|jgi:hypothetical protein|nr:hypothetical protein [Thermoanaerobaculia bacterium]
MHIRASVSELDAAWTIVIAAPLFAAFRATGAGLRPLDSTTTPELQPRGTLTLSGPFCLPLP